MDHKPTPDQSAGDPSPDPRRDERVGASRSGPEGNQAERRLQADRRLLYDRRKLIRFEDDRRAGHERRAGHDPWGLP